MDDQLFERLDPGGLEAYLRGSPGYLPLVAELI